MPRSFNIFGPAGRLAATAIAVPRLAIAGADFIWDEKTIDQLFALGPDHFIPGTKIGQRIAGAEDRQGFQWFLKLSTH